MMKMGIRDRKRRREEREVMETGGDETERNMDTNEGMEKEQE